MIKSWLTDNFDIEYPIILAPMFLVSNTEMMLAAAKAKIMGCVPALNYRTPEEFQKASQEIKSKIKGPWGVNLIVNKSNIQLKKQMEICAQEKPDFIITSLGSPESVIKQCKSSKTKIFCDVTDVAYALKVQDLGADAVIAVNSGAGGHAGQIPASILLPMLKNECKIPVISAGGIGTGSGLLSIMGLGADGVSIGSPFIATTESPVSQEYKDAIVKYGAADIVKTTKVSGSPCTVINTPYVKKIGTDQNILEAFLNKNKNIKKYAKMLTFYKGMKLMEKAAFSATYKTVWCAGPSIEFVTKIEPIGAVVQRMVQEYNVSLNSLCHVQDSATATRPV